VFSATIADITTQHSTSRLSVWKQAKYLLRPLDAHTVDLRHVYTTCTLYNLINDGLVKALVNVVIDNPDSMNGLKATALLNRILEMVHFNSFHKMALYEYNIAELQQFASNVAPSNIEYAIFN
jgi:hypothetical protein